MRSSYGLNQLPPMSLLEHYYRLTLSKLSFRLQNAFFNFIFFQLYFNYKSTRIRVYSYFEFRQLSKIKLYTIKSSGKNSCTEIKLYYKNNNNKPISLINSTLQQKQTIKFIKQKQTDMVIIYKLIWLLYIQFSQYLYQHNRVDLKRILILIYLLPTN